MILKDSDIPEVGNKPDEGYRKAGSWEENGMAVSKMPPDETITENRTFTFTYDEKTEPAEVKTPPTALSLTYNSSARELVTAGTAENGTMQYALGDNDQTAPTSGWSEEISKGTDAKDYYVWYKAKGDADHKDSEERCVTAGISPKNVTITAKDASRSYDGSPLTEGGFTASSLEAGDTHEFAVAMTADSTITNHGTRDNVIATVDEAPVTTGTETPVGNYLVTTAKGTLTVGKCDVTVSVADKEVEYNGSEQEGNPACTFPGVANGQTASMTYTPSKGTLPDTYDNGSFGNDFKVMAGDTDVTSNYNLTTKTAGKLKIKKKDATVKAKDQTIHEGESIQTGTDYAVLTDAAPGHSLSAVTLEAKDGKIEASGASIKDATGADVTANYNITYRPGTLTDRGKISVTVKFKVVNGEWNSGGFGDKEVTLTGYEGDTLKLSADQIPAVGARPNNMYKAGNWDVTPNTETGISKTTTYTYAYVLDQALETAKASAINAVNGVDPAKYVEEDRQKVIDAKTTALNAISAATTTDAVAAAITAFNDAIASCRIEPQPSPDPDEKITISVPPKSVKAKVKGKKLTVSWKKLNKKRKKDKELFKQIRSIDIQVSTDRQFREIVAERKLGKKKTNVTVKIKKKTTYYVRVRYVGDDGVSKWSDVKKVKKKK